MSGRALGRLVARVRRRMWLRALGLALRRGLVTAALLLGIGALLRLWTGWPPADWVAGAAALLLVLPIVPMIRRRLTGRPSLADAARVADRETGAGELLLTAWELEADKPAARQAGEGAAALVARRAATALPDWRRRLDRPGVAPAAGLLLSPLLIMTAMVLLLYATLNDPRGDGAPRAGSRDVAAGSPAPFPAAAALRAAIARIEAGTATAPPPAAGDPADAADARNQPSESRTGPSPSRHLSRAESAANFGPTPGGVPHRAIASLSLASADGAGTAVATDAPRAAAGGKEALSASMTTTEIAVARRGTTPGGPGDPDRRTAPPSAGGRAGDVALPPIPRPSGTPDPADGIGPAGRVLIARYHALLRAGPAGAGSAREPTDGLR